MSDSYKPIEKLNIHEETLVQGDDTTCTTAMRVHGGLIYKFFEIAKSSSIFELKSTQFVPFEWEKPKRIIPNKKKLLKS